MPPPRPPERERSAGVVMAEAQIQVQLDAVQRMIAEGTAALDERTINAVAHLRTQLEAGTYLNAADAMRSMSDEHLEMLYACYMLGSAQLLRAMATAPLPTPG